MQRVGGRIHHEIDVCYSPKCCCRSLQNYFHRGNQMNQVVISGTGLYTPDQSISNAELIACFNALR